MSRAERIAKRARQKKMRRYLTIPEDLKDLEQTNWQTGEKFRKDLSFVSYVIDTLMLDRRWGEGEDNILHAIEIRKAFRDKAVGDVVELRQKEWENLRDTAQRPKFRGGGAYDPETAWQLYSYIEHIKSAPSEPPKVAEPANDNAPAEEKPASEPANDNAEKAAEPAEAAG